jgi:hypothetical protein
MFLDSKYTKIDEYTYSYFDEKTKMNLTLIFRPKELAVDVEKIVTDVLSKLYIESEANNHDL